MFLFCLRNRGESRGGCLCDRECGVNKGGNAIVGRYRERTREGSKNGSIENSPTFLFFQSIQ